MKPEGIDFPGVLNKIVNSEARITVNEAGIATNVANIATNTGNIASHGTRITALEATVIAPHYDSGWVALAGGGVTILTHNLGGSTDKYIVDLQLKDTTGGGLGINIEGYGWFSNPAGNYGWEWYTLSTTQIRLFRGTNDASEQARIRIWKHA